MANNTTDGITQHSKKAVRFGFLRKKPSPYFQKDGSDIVTAVPWM
jgi:hypothetical protein